MNDRIEKRVEVKAPVERIWRAPADHRESGEWLQVRLDGPLVAGQVSPGHITYPGYEHLAWDAFEQAMEPMRRFSFAWHPDAADPDAGRNPARGDGGERWRCVA
jgi:hypothetical protein